MSQSTTHNKNMNTTLNMINNVGHTNNKEPTVKKICLDNSIGAYYLPTHSLYIIGGPRNK